MTPGRRQAISPRRCGARTGLIGPSAGRVINEVGSVFERVSDLRYSAAQLTVGLARVEPLPGGSRVFAVYSWMPQWVTQRGFSGTTAGDPRTTESIASGQPANQIVAGATGIALGWLRLATTRCDLSLRHRRVLFASAATVRLLHIGDTLSAGGQRGLPPFELQVGVQYQMGRLASISRITSGAQPPVGKDSIKKFTRVHDDIVRSYVNLDPADDILRLRGPPRFDHRTRRGLRGRARQAFEER